VVSAAANLSIWSLVTDNLMRLTNGNDTQYNPAGSPDGRAVYYDSNGGSGVQIMRRPADGTGSAAVVAPAPSGYPEIVAADGSFLVYHTVDRIAMLLPLTPPGPARRLMSDVEGSFSDVEISPNGKWIAYESNESGRYEVSVRTFPDLAGRWKVSVAGGMHPLWSRDGRELFFIAGDGMMMSVPIKAGPSFSYGRPVPLFPAGQYHVNVARNYDVSLDGKRFLMVKNAVSPGSQTSMVVVTRWFDEVRAKLAAR
jgi:eukaryotic-like serine/threonine-protein kinase